MIYGWRTKRKRMAFVNETKCGNCENDVLQLYKEYSYVHLMFIPLFFYGKKYFLFCGKCQSVLNITKEEYKKYLESSKEFTARVEQEIELKREQERIAKKQAKNK